VSTGTLQTNAIQWYHEDHFYAYFRRLVLKRKKAKDKTLEIRRFDMVKITSTF
jgi:hypothetical protein